MPDGFKRKRNWTYGSNSVVATLFFLGILVFIALIAEKHPWRLDLTEAGSYTLSEQTLNVLKSLDKPVQIKAFFATAAPEEAKARDLLDSYRYNSKNITFEFIDPDRQPEVAKRYEVRTYGTLVLEGFDRKQTVQVADEENLTNALLKLSRNEQKKVYFLIGHGEHSIANADKDGYSSVKAALDKDNYECRDLNLIQQAEVPKDASAVIVAGPQKPLLSQELESLKSFVDKGGRLMVFVDPFTDGGLRDFLKNYDIQLSDDIVIDKLSRVFGGSYLMPVVMEYGNHKITENFGVATFYPEARSLQLIKPPPEGIHAEVLASTSPNAWAEKNLELLKQGQASFDEKEDTPGPIPLVVLSQASVPAAKAGADKPDQNDAQAKTEGAEDENPGAKKGYLLVAGSSNFVNNTYFGLSGNGDLFLNMVNFMAEEENLITIKPRQGAGQLIMLSAAQAQAMMWLVLVLVPLLVAASGIVVYRVRRSQR